MIPRQALEIAKHFEGWRAEVYICPAGYPTIGYGHRCDPGHPPITEAQGEAYLIEDMASALRAVQIYCPVAMSEPRLAALVDFTFNLGAGRLKTSTLRQRILEQNWSEAVYEIKRWVRGGGRILPGLVLRRQMEADLLILEDTTGGSH